MNLFPFIISLSIAASIGFYYLKDSQDKSQVIEYREAMLDIEQIANTFSESSNTDEALNCEDHDLYPNDVNLPPNIRWRIEIGGLDCDIAKLSFGVSQNKFPLLTRAAVESSATIGEIDNSFSAIHWVHRLHTRRVSEGGVEGAIQNNQYGSCFRCVNQGISINKQYGDGQSAKVGQTVEINPQVKVFLNDGEGNEIGLSDVDVYFYPSGNSTVNPQVQTTDANGLASAQWTMGTETGNYSLNVQPRGVSFSNVVFTASATLGDADAMQAVNWQAGQSGTAGKLFMGNRSLVKVVDQYNNPIPGEPITFRIDQGDGYLGDNNNQTTTVITDPNGIASVSWTLGQIAGPNQLTATHANFGELNFFVEGVAGTPAQLDLSTQPIANTISGKTMTQQPEVIIADQFGNPTQSNGEITVTVANNLDGKAQLSGTTIISATNGVARFEDLSFEGKIGIDYTLQFTFAGLDSVTSNSISVSEPGDPATLTVNSSHSSGAEAGSNSYATATLTDRPGNPIPNQPIAFTVTAGNGSVTTPATTTDNQGVATVSWTLGTRVDTNNLEVTVDDCCSATLSTETYPGPPHDLVMIQPPIPGDIRSGEVFEVQPILQILDRFDNVIYDDQYFILVSIYEDDYYKVRLADQSQVQARNINGTVTFEELAVKAKVGYEFKLKFHVLDDSRFVNTDLRTFSDALTIQNAGDPNSVSYEGNYRINDEMLVFAKVRDDMENLVIGTTVYFLTMRKSIQTVINPGPYSKKAVDTTREASVRFLGYTWGPILAMARWKLSQGDNHLRVSLCENYSNRKCSVSNQRRFDFNYRY